MVFGAAASSAVGAAWGRTVPTAEEDIARIDTGFAQSTLDHPPGIRGGVFFPGYGAGAAFPTLVQIREGVPPATNGPIRVNAPPNAQWQYSGNAYLVLQQAMVDAAGQSFPELMRRL